MFPTFFSYRSICRFLILMLPFVPLSLSAQTDVVIIPYPQEAILSDGTFLFDSPTIYFASGLEKEADYLKSQLANNQIIASLKKKKKSTKGIWLHLTPESEIGTEGYRLNITPKCIEIEAESATGIFYGMQTLLQQLSAHPSQRAVACGSITDAPRFEWRGYMLDESRHFFGKEKVKQLLDMMARYKLNKFHWHLTDEPGWRIEIKKYSKLTSIGGSGNWSDMDSPEVCYYTQDDIREIVQYAADRHIEIIPEIDMPGHATAANRAYPEYSGGGTKEHPDFTFNVGKEETYAYLTDILREVTELFPSNYLHIGGDEVAFGSKAWETDQNVQAMMKREGLKSIKEAERYFMYRMTDSVKALGKILIGWDELLDLNTDPAKTVIMWWRHDRVKALERSLTGGFETILCPRRPLYFDFIQHGSHKWGRTWNGFCPLEDVYTFPDKGYAEWGFSADQLNRIKGIQANLWTERIQSPERFDFMTYPRLCALAEAGWTQSERKSYSSFINRMEYSFPLFDRLGIYYFDFRNPNRHPEPTGAVQKKRDLPMDFRD